MRSDSILRLAAFVFLATMLGFGQASPDPWLIPASGAKVSISANVTRAELVQRYGAANVVDQEVGLGEGDTDTATVLFPKDPERRVEILWLDREKDLQYQAAWLVEHGHGRVAEWRHV